MCSPTPHLVELNRQVKICNRLINYLLKRNPLEPNLSQRDHLVLKSYILLTHAAIKEYLENVALSTLDLAMTKYNTTNLISRPIVSLIAADFLEGVGFRELTKNKSSPNGRKQLRSLVQDMDPVLKRSANGYKTVIVPNNNGIKRKDLESLFLPLGVQVDEVLLAQLDAFGVKRGGLAHSFQAKHQDTPSSTQNSVLGIVREITLLDTALCSSA